MAIITSSQAAKELKVSIRAVQMHCNRIGVDRFGRDYMITTQVMDKLRREVQPGPGRPRKK